MEFFPQQSHQRIMNQIKYPDQFILLPPFHHITSILQRLFTS